MSARFGFIPVVPPFAGAGQEEAVVAAYMARLESLGGVRWHAEDFGDPRSAVLCDGHRRHRACAARRTRAA